MEFDNNNVQPSEDTAIDSKQPESGDGNVFEVNGETVSLEELKNGYMRQGDYTKKTQELAKEKKSKAEAEDQELSPEDERFISLVEKQGYIKKDTLDMIESNRQKEATFKEFSTTYTSLNDGQLQAIKELAKVWGKTYEEVATDYWFLEEARLAKSKVKDPTGRSFVTKKESNPELEAFAQKERDKWKHWGGAI